MKAGERHKFCSVSGPVVSVAVARPVVAVAGPVVAVAGPVVAAAGPVVAAAGPVVCAALGAVYDKLKQQNASKPAKTSCCLSSLRRCHQFMQQARQATK